MIFPTTQATSRAMDINSDSRVCIYSRRRPNSARWNSEQISYGSVTGSHFCERTSGSSSAYGFRQYSSPGSARRKGRQPRARVCTHAAALSTVGARSATVAVLRKTVDTRKRLARQDEPHKRSQRHSPSPPCFQDGTGSTRPRTRCHSRTDTLGTELHPRTLPYPLCSMGTRTS